MCIFRVEKTKRFINKPKNGNNAGTSATNEKKIDLAMDKNRIAVKEKKKKDERKITRDKQKKIM